MGVLPGWEEAPARAPRMLDLRFRISGPCAVPGDYQHLLWKALAQQCPALSEMSDAGVHPLIPIEEGNGWLLDTACGGAVRLPGRTRVVLRIPEAAAGHVAARLEGAVLKLGDARLGLGPAKRQPLVPAATLYARGVIRREPTEQEFIAALRDWGMALGMAAPKVVCGRTRRWAIASGTEVAQSVMLVGLSPAASLIVQERGFGPGRQLGCGLFAPCKAINRD